MQYSDYFENWEGEKWIEFLNGIKILSGDDKIPIKRINSIILYKAVLSEKMVTNNAVTDFIMLNEKSENIKKDNMEFERFKNELYLLVLNTDSEIINSYNTIVYFSVNLNNASEILEIKTIFSGELQSYSQDVNNGLVHFDIAYKLKGKVRKTNPKKEPYLKALKANPNIRFYAQTEIDTNANSTALNGFNIYKINEGADNKISGHGRIVIFNVADVMGDPHALRFDYVTTIKQ